MDTGSGERTLAGRGRYLADIDLPAGALEVAFVRSPFAQARFTSIRGANETGQSLGLRPLRLDGPGLQPEPWTALPSERARYVGEPIAMVWAADRYRAEDAADQVEVDWEALDPEPPRLVFEASGGTGDVEATFASADHVFERTFISARQAGVPIETRGVIAAPADGGRLHLWTATQVPHLVRRDVAAATGIPEGQIRVLVPEVGGGFGLKAHVFAEEIALAAAAWRTGLALRWVEDRRENLIASSHAHDTTVRLALAAARDGRFLAVDAAVSADVGAYSIQPFSASLEPMTCATTLFGPYSVAAFRFQARAFLTNKCPVGALRGVGMNAAVYATERMVDEVAVELGLDPLELRRRNACQQLPVTTASGRDLDSGDYPGLLDELAKRAGYESLRQQQQAARQAGRLFGIGTALFNEHSGTGSADYRRRGVSGVPGIDAATVRVTEEGRLLISTSAAEAGQGHAATYRALAAGELGIDPGRVDVCEGDTDAAPSGTGTFASRGAVGVVEAVVQCLRAVAAADLQPGLEVTRTVDPSQVFPSGAHLAVVEVDPLGYVPSVLSYTAVEDIGTILDQALVDGQVRGGVAMGIGGTVLEAHAYAADGQILTSTLLDYLLPLATDVPPIAMSHLESPSPRTVLGSKGVGEAGTVGAYGAISNAVADAVRPLGAVLDRLPYSPAVLFAAIKVAKAASGERTGTQKAPDEPEPTPS